MADFFCHINHIVFIDELMLDHWKVHKFKLQIYRHTLFYTKNMKFMKIFQVFMFKKKVSTLSLFNCFLLLSFSVMQGIWKSYLTNLRYSKCHQICRILNKRKMVVFLLSYIYIKTFFDNLVEYRLCVKLYQ